MSLPAPGYISNAARTTQERKDSAEDVRDVVGQLLGGGPMAELTVASGVITPPAATNDNCVFRVDTESDAATDDLTHIAQTNTRDGHVVVLTAEDVGRVVTLKHAASGTGQLLLRDGVDCQLTSTDLFVGLFRRGNDWYELFRTKTAPQQPMIVVRDEKSVGTDGGTFTQGAWQTRDLNTELYDAAGRVTVASDQLTLLPGTYSIRWKCPAAQVGLHRSRLQNITGAATVLVGSTAWAGASEAIISHSEGTAVVTLAATTVLEVQHYCQSTKANIGFGQSANLAAINEVYTEVVIQVLL